MNWYLTKLIYRITCGDGSHTPQYEEQLRLIAAMNTEEAISKSRQIGLQETESFYNHKQQLVRWEFINVSEIYPFSKLMDGAELFSRITEEESAEIYESIIHLKSKNIKNAGITEILEHI